MILQALVEHYEDLASQGKLAHPGWSDTNISYALYINDDGELEQAGADHIVDTVEALEKLLMRTED